MDAISATATIHLIVRSRLLDMCAPPPLVIFVTDVTFSANTRKGSSGVNPTSAVFLRSFRGATENDPTKPMDAALPRLT
jgi:hypothetical protein